jgi:hypothetical protein
MHSEQSDTPSQSALDVGRIQFFGIDNKIQRVSPSVQRVEMFVRI